MITSSPPSQVSALLHGPQAPLYIAETVSACREMAASTLGLVVDSLAQVCTVASLRCAVPWWAGVSLPGGPVPPAVRGAHAPVRHRQQRGAQEPQHAPGGDPCE